MSRRHANISVFVPHVGCPNMCSFCDQRHITGVQASPTTQDVSAAVNLAKKSRNYNPEITEIAFFGGSFTAINRNYMMSLLEVAHSFVEAGDVSGMRISTRPDAIDDEILNILKAYSVTSIELGAQSMDDTVLKMNNRGHTAKDVSDASILIKKHGFSLGLQMMTGLYGDCTEKTLKTAGDIIALKPETVRIYPTIVLEGTTLAALYADGYYKPQTIDEAVAVCTDLLAMFERAGISVIRLGLHSIDKNAYVAGPWHPAFSELCYSRIFLKKALGMLKDKGNYILYVSPTDISKMTGQNRHNIIELKNNGFLCKVMPDETVNKNDIRIERRD